MLNAGDVRKVFEAGCGLLLCMLASVCAAADGGGVTDFAVWRPSTGTWFFAPSTNGPASRQWGLPTDIPVAGDFDGDGKTDIAVWRPSTGYWFILQSSDGQVVSRQWGIPTDVPVVGDFDGDGRTDIAVWRPSTGYWYIIQSSTGQLVTRQWGTPTDVPVIGDFDHDGKTDIAVFRPSNGTWYIVQSSNNAVSTQQWGEAGDVPVPGGYDGSGQTNVAVFRPSSGNWYVLESGSQQVTRQWGQSGDIPVPGDYDGDGVTDFAVWRPATGYWYVVQSSNGQVATHQWGAPTDLPIKNFAAAAGLKPSITNVGPSEVTAGGVGFQLFVTGKNFETASSVQWNGIQVSTFQISPSQLVASIPASSIANVGTASISVLTFGITDTGPTPAFVSNSVPFSVSSSTAATATVTTPSFNVSFDTSLGGGPMLNDPFAIAINGPTDATYYYTVSVTGSAVGQLGLPGTTTYGTTVPPGPTAGRITGEPENGEGETVTGTLTGSTLLVNQMSLYAASLMGAGTYTDTITVTLCTDPQCAHPIQDSPIKIPVTYTVTGSAIPDAQFSVANSINFEAPTSASTAPVSTTTISSNGIPPYGVYVFTTFGAAIASATVESNLDGSGTLTVTAKPPAALGSGVYNDAVQISICFDSECKKPAPHFPVSIPVTYVVDASAGVDFTMATVAVPYGDIAWSPTTQRIYATANSDEGGIANSLLVVNPTTAAIEHIVSLGNESDPISIAISDDGEFAYIVDGVANAVIRVNLATLTVDERVPVGLVDSVVKAVPGEPNSFAVESDNNNYAELQIFDGTVVRPHSFTSNVLEGGLPFTFGADASTVYADDGTMYTLSATSGGLAVAQQTPSLLSLDQFDDLQYANGLIYTTTAASVYDPTTNTLEAPFPLQGSNGNYGNGLAFAIDTALNRAFYMTDDEPYQSNDLLMTLQGFNLSTRQSTWITRFPSANPRGGRLIRWGTNGLAFMGAAVRGTPNVSLTLISGSVVSR